MPWNVLHFFSLTVSILTILIAIVHVAYMRITHTILILMERDTHTGGILLRFSVPWLITITLTSVACVVSSILAVCTLSAMITFEVFSIRTFFDHILSAIGQGTLTVYLYLYGRGFTHKKEDRETQQGGWQHR